jgi:hypothetical protein
VLGIIAVLILLVRLFAPTAVLESLDAGTLVLVLGGLLVAVMMAVAVVLFRLDRLVECGLVCGGVVGGVWVLGGVDRVVG